MAILLTKKRVSSLKKGISIVLALILSLYLFGCGRQKTLDSLLNPNHPVTITLWNYYNGQTKESFDSLVAKFNDTVGVEKGIIVDSVSHGDVDQLAEAVYNAANDKIGAESMPHLFLAYPDNVFRIDQLGKIANLNDYFSEEELSAFRQDFLKDAYFGEENNLKLIPTVRSTDNLYLNKTDWDKFSFATGAESESLSTWEGLLDTAEKYYQWTDSLTAEKNDGRAFFGLDSFANFILIASIQLEKEVYNFEGTQVKFHFDKEFAKVIWDNIYVPYMKGYYASYGRFSSDDEKTGDILAYIGSSAGAQYFPIEVSMNKQEAYPIKSEVFPYPVFQNAKDVAIGQGAGFAVAKSDEAHEYAAAVFLKWFTQKEQNVAFSIASGYLPVTVEALDLNLTEEAKKYNEQFLESPTVEQSISTTQKMLNEYQFYANPPFYGSFDLRGLFNVSLKNLIKSDLIKIQYELEAGKEKEDALKPFLQKSYFENWYQEFMKEVQLILEE